MVNLNQQLSDEGRMSCLSLIQYPHKINFVVNSKTIKKNKFTRRFDLKQKRKCGAGDCTLTIQYVRRVASHILHTVCASEAILAVGETVEWSVFFF
jgi:hypothetical protein